MALLHKTPTPSLATNEHLAYSTETLPVTVTNVRETRQPIRASHEEPGVSYAMHEHALTAQVTCPAIRFGRYYQRTRVARPGATMWMWTRRLILKKSDDAGAQLGERSCDNRIQLLFASATSQSHGLYDSC